MKLQIKHVLASAILILLTSCSDSDKTKEPTPEEIAENKRQYKLYEEKKERIERSVIEADDSKLIELLSQCRTLITEYANARNKGPFAIHMIDSYSADGYQYAAGKEAMMTVEQRIEYFRSNGYAGRLNTEYAILSAYDSFDGPKKAVDNYKCEIDTGPVAASVTKAY